MPECLSPTELGQIYCVTRNRVGQALVDLGLRMKEKKPSRIALDGGYVDQRPSREPNTYYWTWFQKADRQEA